MPRQVLISMWREGVGDRAGVGHTEQSLLGVLQLEVLIIKLGSIDGLSTCSISLGEVSALDHEVLDHTVERRVLVAEALFACAESAEVLCCLWRSLSIQSHHNSAQLLISLLDIEVDLVGDLGALLSFGGLSEVDECEGENDHEGH